MNYAPVISAEEFYEYDEETAAESGVICAELLTTTIILGLVKFVITTFVLFQVDKLGRRFLLKAGAGIVTVSLLFLAIGFSVSLEVETITGELEYSHMEPQKALVLTRRNQRFTAHTGQVYGCKPSSEVQPITVG